MIVWGQFFICPKAARKKECFGALLGQDALFALG